MVKQFVKTLFWIIVWIWVVKYFFYPAMGATAAALFGIIILCIPSAIEEFKHPYR